MNDNYKLTIKKNEITISENPSKNIQSKDNNLINNNIFPDKPNKSFINNTFNKTNIKKENDNPKEEMKNINSDKKKNLLKE